MELTIDVDLGGGVHLELCTRCDPGGGLSGEFLAMLTSGLMPADRFAKVSMEWMYEALAAQGWYQIPRQPRG
ncbi:hypothetical protein [Kitasatospora sp. NPDC057223]|uniref:hypothetical protein n=1 Tax=Kitasatospora sp. NPDC057223 TaxID=3346055 RepID=UPI00364044FF